MAHETVIHPIEMTENSIMRYAFILMALTFVMPQLRAADEQKKSQKPKASAKARIIIRKQNAGSVVAQPAIALKAMKIKKKKVAYLGVSMRPVPATLGAHLNLAPGIGLIVDVAMPKSPAAAAGIKKHDVLHKLGDQLVVNAEQFRTLIRTHKKGDKIELTILRQAKSIKLNVELGEHEVADYTALPGHAPGQPFGQAGQIQRLWRAAPGSFQFQQLKPGDWQKYIPKELQEQLKKQLGPGVFKNIPHIELDFQLNGQPLADQIRKQMDKLRLQLKIPPQLQLQLGFGNGKAASVAQATFADGQHILTLIIRDGHRHLKVTHKNGKVIFDGPINTDAQRKKLPKDIQPKLQRLEKQINVKVHVTPLKQAQPRKLQLRKLQPGKPQLKKAPAPQPPKAPPAPPAPKAPKNDAA